MSFSSPLLVIDRVSKSFVQKEQTVEVFKDLSLSFEAEKFICLLGPSGCGKTTLLNLIAGLDFPDKGSLFLDGKPIVSPGSDRMVLFQEPALFPWLNVIDNVMFGIKLKKTIPRSERKETAEFYLRLVGLENFAKSMIHELSGGMKQRAALARSLAPNPQILLMDEPFASLDEMSREQLYTDIQHIWKNEKKTIIFVTHNVLEAVCLGDQVIVCCKRPFNEIIHFPIPLPRHRDVRDLEVARYASEISYTLRGGK